MNYRNKLKFDEGSCRGLIWGTAPTFGWNKIRRLGAPAQIWNEEPGIHVRRVTAQTSLLGVEIKFTVFWDTSQCRFGGTCWLHLQARRILISYLVKHATGGQETMKKGNWGTPTAWSLIKRRMPGPSWKNMHIHKMYNLKVRLNYNVTAKH
jgi:hypothetical protein